MSIWRVDNTSLILAEMTAIKPKEVSSTNCANSLNYLRKPLRAGRFSAGYMNKGFYTPHAPTAGKYRNTRTEVAAQML